MQCLFQSQNFASVFQGLCPDYLIQVYAVRGITTSWLFNSLFQTQESPEMSQQNLVLETILPKINHTKFRIQPNNPIQLHRIKFALLCQIPNSDFVTSSSINDRNLRNHMSMIYFLVVRMSKNKIYLLIIQFFCDRSQNSIERLLSLRDQKLCRGALHPATLTVRSVPDRSSPVLQQTDNQ